MARGSDFKRTADERLSIWDEEHRLVRCGDKAYVFTSSLQGSSDHPMTPVQLVDAYLQGAIDSKKVHKYIEQRDAKFVKTLNALLPFSMQRSGSQLHHILNCPLQITMQNHICGPACGYPG